MNKPQILKSSLSVLRKDKTLCASLLRNILRLFRLKLRYPFRKKINIGLTEHLGDIIAAEPIIRDIRKKHSGAFITWFVKKEYKELLVHNPDVSKVYEMSSLTEWIFLKKFIRPGNCIDLHIDGKICSKHGFHLRNKNPSGINTDNYYDHGNLLHAFSKTAGIELDTTQAPELHVKMDNAPVRKGKFIVIHTGSNEKQRGLTTETWTALAEKIIEKFPGIGVVEVGFQQYIKTNIEGYVNFTKQRPLKEIANLVSHAKLFIGIDSGFAHMANALNKEAVIILGELNKFRRYMPYSGKYQREAGDTIFYYNGKLEELTVNDVFPFIEKKLVNLV